MSERTKTIAEVSAVNMQSVDNVLVTAGGGIAKVSKSNFVPASAGSMTCAEIPGTASTLGNLKAALLAWAGGGGAKVGSVGKKSFNVPQFVTAANGTDDSAAIGAGTYSTFTRMDSYGNASYFHFVMHTIDASAPIVSIIYDGWWHFKKY